MVEDAPGPLPGRPQWTVGDFALAVLGGLAGALLGAGAGAVAADQSVALVVALLGQYAGHLLALAYVVRRRGASLEDLGLEVVPIDGIYLLLGVGLQFAVALLFLPLAMLLETEGSQQAITDLIPEAQGAAVRAVLVLSVALLAPVVEETMFRGLLMKVAERRRGPVFALVTTSFVFALFHLLGIGTADPVRAALLLVPQLFVVGLVLGRQVQRHGRLGVAIFTHAGFNLVAVVALFLAPDLAG